MNGNVKRPRRPLVVGLFVFAALAVFIVLALSIRDPSPPGLPHVRPEAISLRLSGGRSYDYDGFKDMSITYEAPNDYVIYLPFDGEKRKISVSEKDLIAFVRILNKAGFASWETRYPRTATDGGSWSLRVAFEGANYYSSGDTSSAVPDCNNLNRALRRLISDNSISICNEWVQKLDQSE